MHDWPQADERAIVVVGEQARAGSWVELRDGEGMEGSLAL